MAVSHQNLTWQPCHSPESQFIYTYTFCKKKKKKTKQSDMTHISPTNMSIWCVETQTAKLYSGDSAVKKHGLL